MTKITTNQRWCSLGLADVMASLIVAGIALSLVYLGTGNRALFHASAVLAGVTCVLFLGQLVIAVFRGSRR